MADDTRRVNEISKFSNNIDVTDRQVHLDNNHWINEINSVIIHIYVDTEIYCKPCKYIYAKVLHHILRIFYDLRNIHWNEIYK